jgi:hypothetical protein
MAAPEIVNVMYRNIDGVHVFTSKDVRGLYVAGRDLRQTYEEVPEALHELMKYHRIDASYRPTMSTEEFLRFVGHIDSGDIPHPAVIAAQNVAYNRAA